MGQGGLELFIRSREALKRDACIFAGLTLVFWVAARNSGPETPPDFILYLICGVSILLTYFGLSVILKIRSVGRAIGKSWAAIIFYQFASFLFFILGGPLLFSFLVLKEAGAKWEAGQITEETVSRKRSSWAGWVAGCAMAGLIILLLSLLSIPGLLRARLSARIHEGQQMLKEGRYSEAAARFREILEGSPAETDVYLYLGLSLYEQGRLEEAGQSLSRYLEKSKNRQRYFASVQLPAEVWSEWAADREKARTLLAEIRKKGNRE